MTEYSEILLDHDAFEYMQMYLENGNTLSDYLLKVLNTNKGKIVTYLPSDTSTESVTSFQSGGKIPIKQPTNLLKNRERESHIVPKPNTNSWLASNIQSYLCGKQNRICILEDVTSRPGDFFLNSLEEKYFSVRDEVYFALSSSECDEHKITEFIQCVRSRWHFVCAMTSMETDAKIQEFSLSLLQRLTEQVAKIAVGAYDGESYLIWSRM